MLRSHDRYKPVSLVIGSIQILEFLNTRRTRKIILEMQIFPRVLTVMSHINIHIMMCFL